MAERTFSTDLTVVGLSFRWSKDGRRILKQACPFPVSLEREPENEHDENAIKVNVAMHRPIKKLYGRHLGYLRANIAAKLAPVIDDGSVKPVKLWVTGIDLENSTAALEATFSDSRPAKKRKRKSA